MASNEQSHTGTFVLLGGAALALGLLVVGRRAGQGGPAGGEPGSGTPAQPVQPGVNLWLRGGDRIEVEGVRTDLATAVAYAHEVGRVSLHATGDARAGWVGAVINALRAAHVEIFADKELRAEADYLAALARETGPRNAARRRRARPSAGASTPDTGEPEPAELAGGPPYAWQRGLDMDESRRLAASLNQAARNDEARREAALLHARPPAELRARVSVGGTDGTQILVDTEANTGVANEAYRALKAAQVHIWDTQGSRLIISSRDRGNNPRVEQARAKTVDVLRAAGFVVDEDATSSPQAPRNAARRRNTLPRFDERKGMWRGGDSRTLYLFTGWRTGQTWVSPGQWTMNWGPEASVRVATRAEAEELWQRPLHAGWIVDESPRNAAGEPTHLAVLRRVGNERFATKRLFGDGRTVLNTSTTVQGAIASAPARGDLQVRGEYTSDGSHWGLGLGRLVARREHGRWLIG